MCRDASLGSRTLLVILPGAVGRRPVLERLLTWARVCVAVPSSDLRRSEWARAVVGPGMFLEWQGSAADVEEACRAIQAWSQTSSRRVEGIMCYDEFGVELASHLCERLGFPGTPAREVCRLRDKHQFRERCREAGLPAARSVRLRDPEDLDAFLKSAPVLRFPCVLKPARGAGSYYLQKVANPEELKRIYDEFQASIKGGPLPEEIAEACFTLEEYFEGHEVDVDGWARDGKVEFMMVNDNRPAVEPGFLETGGCYPSQLPAPAVRALERLTEEVVAAFPGYHGCFHFEARIDVETLAVMPIELNARVGGAECPAAVEAVSGHDLVTVAARLALGLPLEGPRPPRHRVVASTNLHLSQPGVVLVDLSSEGLDRAGCNVVLDVLFRSAIRGPPPIPSLGSAGCLGILATGGRDAQEAEAMLCRAVEQLRIEVAPFPEGALPAML